MKKAGIKDNASELKKSDGLQTKVCRDDGLIKDLAFRIYQEKGGSALNNWLEAERILTCGCV